MQSSPHLARREEPTPAIEGNAYAQTMASLPLTWEAAIDAFREHTGATWATPRTKIE